MALWSMSTHSDKNTSSGSTTWAWRRVKISERPPGPYGTAAEGVRRKRLTARNPRDPLTVTIAYRGGAECWWEIRSRGVTLRRPGSLALHDVLSELQGQALSGAAVAAESPPSRRR